MMYTFTEITDFKLDDYTPHMGRIGDKQTRFTAKKKQPATSCMTEIVTGCLNFQWGARN